MTGIAVFALAFQITQGPAAPPPPDLTPHREIAVARRDDMRSFGLADAKFVVRKPVRRGERTPLGPPIELTSSEQARLVALLDSVETYSEERGVFGCVGREFVLTVERRERKFESWFCSECQRIFPVMRKNEDRGFDAALSSKGAAAIRVLLREVERRGRVR